jgi:hypothetical protein
MTFAYSSVAENVILDFAVGMGNTGEDRGLAITVDPAKNIYTAGSFTGTVDFDPGIGEANLSSTGRTDTFIQKLDPDGRMLWAVSISGEFANFPRAITMDESRNLYTSGVFQGITDFDPGPGMFNLASPAGVDHYFVLKLDSEGNFLWAKSWGAAAHPSNMNIALDSVGNVVTSGEFSGTVDFDPGPGTFNIESTGHANVFVNKLDGAGNFIGAISFSGGDSVFPSLCTGMALDSLDNVYTTGQASGMVDFDPGSGTAELSGTYLCKLNSDGDLVWLNQLAFDSQMIHLAAGPSDSIYLIGMVVPGFEALRKFDSDGTLLWAREYNALPTDLVVDSTGAVYTIGLFVAAADFDPGPGTAFLDTAGESDVVISKLNPEGLFVWATAVGGHDFDSGNGIAVDSSTNVYATGFFRATADFDPSIHTADLTAPGTLSNIFVLKLRSTGGGGGNCLIAHLTRGTPLAKELDTLRAFRDQALLTNSIGSAFANVYYQMSPTAVGWYSPICDFLRSKMAWSLTLLAACMLVIGSAAYYRRSSPGNPS